MKNTGKKVAIVTGASRGIGAAIAQKLASDGYGVVGVARSDALLRSVIDSLPTASLTVALDLRAEGAGREVVAATRSAFGRVDLLVNNAGATPRGDFLSFKDADWQDGFALKLFGAVALSRECWPALVDTQGAIINIAGIGGRTGSADFTIGGAVNAALLNLTKALADRGIEDGVRVNAVNPSSITTERTYRRLQSIAASEGLSLDDAAERMAKGLGVARLGSPAEVAEVVSFLASESATYMQGAIVDVDGGRTRTL